MNIDRIKAVHPEDIEKYLEGLGILQDVKLGKFTCGGCGKSITLDNIMCIYPEDEKIQFCCDDPKCYEILIRKRTSENA